MPWEPGEALKAAKICFDAWLDARGGVEPAEVRDGINAVKAFLSANGTSRFLAAWEDRADEARIPNLAGFRRKVGDSIEYLITTDAWPEIAAGFDPKSLAAALADRNLLVLPSSGPHRAKMVRIPGHGNRRVYHISPDLLEDPNA